MTATAILFVIVVGILLVGLLYMLWRFWEDYARITPEETEYERDMASLNDAQANRFRDDQLTRQIDADTAWQVMVRRGRRAAGRGRRRRK
jgi:hypothetical protein